MCGIFATIGTKNNAPDLVVKGLKKLEYRGYDSWGVAYKGQVSSGKLQAASDKLQVTSCKLQNKKSACNDICIYKTIGKISDFDVKKTKFENAQIAIGHTRWATHGGVTNANAHPHTDCCNRISVVHNGIIENFAELRDELKKRGHHFKSQTDTEVAAHLIEEHMNLGLEKAVKKAIARLAGRFAIVAICSDEEKIVAARRGSPLIVGKAENQIYIASDIPAFLEYTRDVNFIDDDEMAIADKKNVEFFSLKTGEKIKKRLITIDWKSEEAEKGEFTHFMLKEIFDQKDSIARAINQSDKEIKDVAAKILKARGVFWVGCGTAGKVCHAGEYFFADVAKRHTNFAPASEFPLFHNFLKPETLIFAVSQSGETADVLEAMEVAEQAGSSIFSLVNVSTSSIARKSDVSICIKAGPEKAVASTKAATSQLTILLLLAFAAAGKLDEGKKLLIDTAANVNELLNPRFVKHVEKIAKKIHKQENMFIIGKGANYPMALEAAIKIQEVSQIHAEGFAGGELKHGPIAMVEDGVPCLILVGDDESANDILQNAIELKARGAQIIGIAPKNNEIFDYFIRVPYSKQASAIVNLIPIQLLAFFLAVFRGKNPDMPKNLAKSVTVK